VPCLRSCSGGGMAAPEIECEACEGTGRCEYEAIIGGVSNQSPWQSYRVYEAECHVCQGTGYTDAEDK